MRVCKLIRRGVWATVLSMVFGSAHATIISFDLDTEFSGAFPPAGPAPWVTATFDDGDTPGSVRLTLDLVGLTDAEFLSSFYFNLDPSFNAAALGSSNQDTTNTSFDSFIRGNDCCQPDGDGLMDAVFSFDANDFTAGETWAIDLNLAGITAASFDVLSTPAGNSPNGLPLAAHIQGIDDPQCPPTPEGDPDPNCRSGWITGDPGGGPPQQIPEPGVLALLGSGFLGFTLARRRRRKNV